MPLKTYHFVLFFYLMNSSLKNSKQIEKINNCMPIKMQTHLSLLDKLLFKSTVLYLMALIVMPSTCNYKN